MKHLLLLIFAFCVSAACFGNDNGRISAVYTVRGELDKANGHIQGMCASGDAFYLSHQSGIFKLDNQGKLIKHIPVPVHTGDICYHDGKVYSAVAYYDKARRGKGCIRVYDADLNEINKYELNKAADGITYLNGYLYFGIGPNPQKPHRINRVARIKADFSDELEVTEIDIGYKTYFGVQTMCSDGEFLYMCFYAAENIGFAVYTPDLKLVKTGTFSASIGIDHLKINGRSTFIRLKSFYNWKKKESPQFRLDFHKYVDGNMVRISRNDPEKEREIKNNKNKNAAQRAKK